MIQIQATPLKQLAVQMSLARVIPVLVVIAVIAIGVVALDVPSSSFRSPDEHASFKFTEVFADTGRLYYTADYLDSDAENLLHPRGAITHEGRAVPFNYLGLPVLYAPAHKVLGEYTRYVGIVFGVAAVIAMARAGSFATPGRPWIAWAAVLGATPVIYYLNRPFLNSLPAFTFFAVGIWLLLQASRHSHPEASWPFRGAAAALALAAFARYEFVIFNTLLVLLFVWYVSKGSMRRKRVLNGFGTYAVITGAFFLVPVMTLNAFTYGSATEYGYGLFNEAFYPERSAGGTAFPMNVVAFARSILLPSYPLDIALAGKAFVRQVVGVAPVFAAVATLGVVAVVRNRVLPWHLLIAVCAGVTYVYLYRGAGYSWLADSPDSNLEASVVRYSLPLYLLFYLLGVYAIAQIKESMIAAFMVVLLAFLGVTGSVATVDGSLLHIRTQVRHSEEVTQQEVLPNVESNAIVYTDIFDKTVGPHRDVAGWWGGVRGTYEGFFRPRDVARSIARVYPDRPVYVYVFEEEFVVPLLRAQLTSWNLTITPMEPRRLYKVERLPSRLDVRPVAMR